MNERIQELVELCTTQHRCVMTMLDNLTWSEWVLLAQAEETDTCMSCGGLGNHGYDDEGCEMVCYGCYGTGKYFLDPA